MINNEIIPFNKPYMTGKELYCIAKALFNGSLAGDGPFTKQCHEWLENATGAKKALLSHSCTAALEMTAILMDICPGDEIILPSYTFVSTANAFVLRGGVPVFVDIREDTLNMDERLLETLITSRTKAIVPVHYAGVACEMDTIMDIASCHGLRVIEDAAQGVMASYKGKPLGALGDLGAFSFHETKNIISGEGGALIINDSELVERAEIIREKGTNRKRFLHGQVDKYTWVEKGSSYLPGEIIAAFLWAQLQEAEEITNQRISIWNYYHNAFEALEREDRLRRPIVPDGCKHNAHMYYLILKDNTSRALFIKLMKEHGVHCVFHYIPLHDSPAGRQYSNKSVDLPVTRDVWERIVRLPLWVGMDHVQDRVIDAVFKCLNRME